MKSRLNSVRERLAEEGLDGILISQPENRRYLSRFTGSAGWLFITADQAVIAVDSRYYEQAERQAPTFELFRIAGKYNDNLPKIIAGSDAKRIGFESSHVTYKAYIEWSEIAEGESFRLDPVGDLVEALRAIKDEGELAVIERAVNLTDEAFAYALDAIEPGMTEKDLAWEIEAFMRTHGAEAVAFDVIVAAGPNSALPHYRAGDEVLEVGQPVLIDMGARLDGYNADLTRTFCLGDADEKFREVYDLVLKAQLSAEEGIRPGMTGVEVDTLARDVIEEAGHSDKFGHGLGHGVGLAIHEAPRLSRYAENGGLKPGMVVTVEPGVYLPGWGGVRIEDIVVVREDDVEVLSKASKDPTMRL